MAKLSSQPVHRGNAVALSGNGVCKRPNRTNVRAWKEEEEAYLLEARSRSIPYRQIAAHLRKTELACRLHFHQMTFGNNRRKGQALDAPSDASHSPSSVYEECRSGLTTPVFNVQHSASASMSSLLPPVSDFGYSPRHHSPAKSISEGLRPPKTRYAFEGTSSEYSHSDPTLPWQSASRNPVSTASIVPGNVDLTRLLDVYADNSRAFWSNIANQYSGSTGKSPSELETAFFAAFGAGRALWPRSPKADAKHLAPLDWPYHASMDGPDHPRSFSEPQASVRGEVLAPSPKRCTVSSLLNSEQESGMRSWAVGRA